MGDFGIGAFMQMVGIILLIFVPLGIWKIVDIIIWCVHHLSVHVH